MTSTISRAGRSIMLIPPDRQRRLLLLLQGTYYTVIGVWPLVSMHTFEAMTGPKTDRWLVKTVGVLVTAIGGVLLGSGLRRERATPESIALACGSAAGLAAIDVVYAVRRRISRIYLLDAVAELFLIAAFAHVWWHVRDRGSVRPGSSEGAP